MSAIMSFISFSRIPHLIPTSPRGCSFFLPPVGPAARPTTQNLRAQTSQDIRERASGPAHTLRADQPAHRALAFRARKSRGIGIASELRLAPGKRHAVIRTAAGMACRADLESAVQSVL